VKWLSLLTLNQASQVRTLAEETFDEKKIPASFFFINFSTKHVRLQHTGGGVSHTLRAATWQAV
jgi:hypothetical protein